MTSTINATSLSEANAILALQGHTMRLSRIWTSPSVYYNVCPVCGLAGEWQPEPTREWKERHGTLYGPATRTICGNPPSTNGDG